MTVTIELKEDYYFSKSNTDGKVHLYEKSSILSSIF